MHITFARIDHILARPLFASRINNRKTKGGEKCASIRLQCDMCSIRIYGKCVRSLDCVKQMLTRLLVQSTG